LIENVEDNEVLMTLVNDRKSGEARKAQAKADSGFPLINESMKIHETGDNYGIRSCV